MTDAQRKILTVLACAIVAMLLYPPYAVRGNMNNPSVVIDSGYAFLLNLPHRATIEVGTLLIQWIAVLMVAAIAFLLAKRR